MSLWDSHCCSEPVSYAAVEEDGTSGPVTEVFDYSDKVDADVVRLHGWPTSCMSNHREHYHGMSPSLQQAHHHPS